MTDVQQAQPTVERDAVPTAVLPPNVDNTRRSLARNARSILAVASMVS